MKNTFACAPVQMAARPNSDYIDPDLCEADFDGTLRRFLDAATSARVKECKPHAQDTLWGYIHQVRFAPFDDKSYACARHGLLLLGLTTGERFCTKETEFENDCEQWVKFRDSDDARAEETWERIALYLGVGVLLIGLGAWLIVPFINGVIWLGGQR